MPWVRRYDYDRMLMSIAGAEARAKADRELADAFGAKLDAARQDAALLRLSVERLSARNLEMQQLLAQARVATPANDGSLTDIFAEEEEDVSKLIADIHKYGRDVVIAREASNERVE